MVQDGAKREIVLSSLKMRIGRYFRVVLCRGRRTEQGAKASMPLAKSDVGASYEETRVRQASRALTLAEVNPPGEGFFRQQNMICWQHLQQSGDRSFHPEGHLGGASQCPSNHHRGKGGSLRQTREV